MDKEDIPYEKYVKPAKTYRELLTKKDMANLLKEYIEEDIEKIPVSSHVRYIKLKDNKQQFFTGGTIIFKGDNYVILSNKNKYSKKPRITWSVQKSVEDKNGEEFKTVFFVKITTMEMQLKEEILGLEEKVLEQDEIIEKQNKEILKLKKYLKKFKEELSLHQ